MGAYSIAGHNQALDRFYTETEPRTRNQVVSKLAGSRVRQHSKLDTNTELRVNESQLRMLVPVFMLEETETTQKRFF